MKYHKIRGVEKETCTAEQMIAYNAAFRLHISFQDEFDKVNAEAPGNAQADCLKLVQIAMKQYRNQYDYKPGQYDEDAIESALRAGIYDYMCKPFIGSNYTQIGKAFPALYL